MAKKKVPLKAGVVHVADDETTKKVVENFESLEEPVEEVADEPVLKSEPLLTVTVSEDFKDGALSARFAKYGYETLWKKGETRQIPMNLFVRCKRSGAKFEL